MNFFYQPEKFLNDKLSPGNKGVRHPWKAKFCEKSPGKQLLISVYEERIPWKPLITPFENLSDEQTALLKSSLRPPWKNSSKPLFGLKMK